MFLNCVKNKKSDKALYLLDKKRGDKKADPNTKDYEGKFALHYAAINGDTSLVNALLYYSAIIDVLD